MNKIWLFVMGICMIIMTVISPESVLETFLSGAENAVELTLVLLPIYVVWSGVLELMNASGLGSVVAKLFSPLTRKLFPGESQRAKEYISMNFAANLLGMGAAATPLGISAVNSMDDGSEKATEAMSIFTVINTTSLQLIPSTLIALRIKAGSGSASDIILPALIVSMITTVFAVILVKIFKR